MYKLFEEFDGEKEFVTMDIPDNKYNFFRINKIEYQIIKFEDVYLLKIVFNFINNFTNYILYPVREPTKYDSEILNILMIELKDFINKIHTKFLYDYNICPVTVKDIINKILREI